MTIAAIFKIHRYHDSIHGDVQKLGSRPADTSILRIDIKLLQDLKEGRQQIMVGTDTIQRSRPLTRVTAMDINLDCYYSQAIRLA